MTFLRSCNFVLQAKKVFTNQALFSTTELQREIASENLLIDFNFFDFNRFAFWLGFNTIIHGILHSINTNENTIVIYYKNKL